MQNEQYNISPEYYEDFMAVKFLRARNFKWIKRLLCFNNAISGVWSTMRHAGDRILAARQNLRLCVPHRIIPPTKKPGGQTTISFEGQNGPFDFILPPRATTLDISF